MRIATIQGGSIYYHHNDHLGTPLALTDSNAALVWSAAYTPFGKAQVDQGSTVVNNFRFPGQYYDAESGLHYNWHRYYDPKTGRYLTADPLGFWGDIVNININDHNSTEHLRLGLSRTSKYKNKEIKNMLYPYANNNPIANLDPYGLWHVTDTVTETFKTCWRDPIEKERCNCLCQISSKPGCEELCMDCFSSRPKSPKDVCMCACRLSDLSERNCKIACGIVCPEKTEGE